MRWVVGIVIGVTAFVGPQTVWAGARSFEQLPQDVWNIATEPIKSVARETRRFDPISSLWFGLMEGSMKSVQRTAAIFLGGQSAAPLTRPHDRQQARYPF